MSTRTPITANIVDTLRRLRDAHSSLCEIFETALEQSLPSDTQTLQQAHEILFNINSVSYDQLQRDIFGTLLNRPYPVEPTPTAPMTAECVTADESSSVVAAVVVVDTDTETSAKRPRKKRSRDPATRLFTFAKDGFICPLGCETRYETTKRRPHPDPPADWFIKSDGTPMSRQEKLDKRICATCYSSIYYATKRKEKKKKKRKKDDNLSDPSPQRDDDDDDDDDDNGDMHALSI